MGDAYRRIAWAALLLACLPGVAGASEGAGLFSADAGAEPLRQPARRLPAEGFGAGGAPHGSAFPEFPSSGELRSRSARMDLGRLSAARMEVEQGSPSRLSLNLFADAEFEAVIERTALTASGYTLTGRLADEPMSIVALAVNGDYVSGTVWSRRGLHAIRASGGIAEVRQMDPTASGHGDAGPLRTLPPATSAGSIQGANAAPADDGGVIDVLVLYPPFVRRYQGGHGAMRALIEQDIAITNEIYRGSGVAFRIALVAAVEADYAKRDPSVGIAIWDIIGEADGHMDEAHALRDSYAADLVLLHWGDHPTPDSAIAASERLTSEAHSSGLSAAFSVVADSIPSDIAQAFGYNMGLDNDRTSVFSAPGGSTRRPVYPYGYGYRARDPAAPFGYWGTVMTEKSGLPIPRFSNPNQKWPDESGVPIGVPGDEWSDRVEGPADAVRALNNIRRHVANYRRSASRCAYALSPEPGTVPATGGEYRIRVRAEPGCAWMARADGDGFATVAAGGRGIGEGEAAYRVAANEGWGREVAILVAGEVYSMWQAGARALMPVCERPLPIRRAISDAVGKPCAEVTHSDLAAIRKLSMYPQSGATVLMPGMLDGLSGLRELGFGHGFQVRPGVFEGLANLNVLRIVSRLTDLPRGMFDGLPNLYRLELPWNRLTALRKDSFKNLPNLRYLDLYSNQLSALEAGAFNGLSRLDTLRLQDNNLKTLEPGVFDGMPKLRDLGLSDNSLTELGPGLFDGERLPSLTYLGLQNNRLTALSPGTFDGLNLHSLELQGNSLALSPRAFNGLRAFALDLSDNGMTNLPPGVFDGLSGLYMLELQGNRLATLPAGLLRGLAGVHELYLQGNRLAALPAGLLRGLDGLEHLMLGGNRLEGLPFGLFDGLAQLRQLDLSGNPGAPFPLTLELVPATSYDAGRDGSVNISMEVAEGAPFDIAARLSASGAKLSAQEILVPRGRTRGEAVSVLPAGGGPVTIELEPVPAVQHPSCGKDFPWATRYSPSCHLGVRAVAGPPLVLHGLADQTLATDSTVKFHLPTAFPNFGEGASYAVESSDPAAVKVTIRGGLLIVSAANGGKTTLTVTATDPNSGLSATLSFKVTAEQSIIRSRWGGWRSVLLQPPSSEDGDES